MKERVERGAQFLDQLMPGWEEIIDLEVLNLGSCFTCILGQLKHDYTEFLDIYSEEIEEFCMKFEKYRTSVTRFPEKFLGFSSDNPIEFKELTQLWKELIYERNQ